MPYPGVPPEKTAAMEACVKKVMATGKDKHRAIAICHSSIMGKKEVGMTNKRPGKRERRALREAAVRLADAKEMDLPEEPEVEVPDVSEPEPEGVEAKDMGMIAGASEAYCPFDGATTFADYDAWVAGRDKASQAYQLTSVLRDLVDNILEDESIKDKGKAIAAVGAEFQTRIKKEPTTAKGFVDRIADFLGFRPADEPAKVEPSAKQVPVDKKSASASFIVRKEADGSYRWFGWVSNKWRDVDVLASPANGGEIITETAHKEFVAYLDAHPDKAPGLWAWHTPGTEHGKADWWDYADGFLVMSGPLKEAVGKSFEAETDPVAMSHGFYAIPPWRDVAKGLINKYRTFEVSHLPLARAANPWTDFETIRKEADMFNPEKRPYLVKRLGEPEVARLESDTKARAELLEALGVESKQLTEPPSPEAPPAPPLTPPVPPTTTPAAPAPGIVTEDPAEKAIPPAAPAPAAEPTAAAIEAILKTLDVPGLNAYLKGLTDKLTAQGETIKQLTAQVADTKKSTDEHIAELITPPVAQVRPIWSQRPSQSDETKLGESDEDKALKDAGPRASWVKDALGPVTQ